jgi:glycosyltransferase involved in cell wall biosynthesis
MKSMVEKSFLKGYPTIVINNGIDLQVFNPIKSSIRKKLGILKNEYMILGVSFGWSIYKGIDVFEKLAESLPHNFKIVLVGTDDAVDRILPKNIISIHRTSNQTELAKLYSAADVFVNATREENFPTVHLEALACGTPVVSFDTGGCKEMLSANSGCVVPTNDIEQLQAKIMDVCVNKVFKSEDCIKQSKRYDKDSAYEKYLQLYRGLTLD